ncbi:MAG: BolA/IbaG family iron-sulfur metabolism protein [Gammaproteobacteria bacterium]|jgi:monothiol glutaredoxin
MQIDEVKNLILQDLPDAEIHVQGEDCNFSVDVISTLFDSVTKLNRQRKVLGAVKEQIQNGDIHALSVKAFTPEEWAKQGELKVL